MLASEFVQEDDLSELLPKLIVIVWLALEMFFSLDEGLDQNFYLVLDAYQWEFFHLGA